MSKRRLIGYTVAVLVTAVASVCIAYYVHRMAYSRGMLLREATALPIIPNTLRAILLETGETPPLVFVSDAGTPTVSWRAAVYKRLFTGARINFKLKWDDPTNLTYSNDMPLFFCSDRFRRFRVEANTHVFAIDTEDNLFGLKGIGDVSAIPHDTAVAIAIHNECSHPWLKPGDARIEKGKIRVGDCSIEVDESTECLVVFWDAEVWQVRGERGLGWAAKLSSIRTAAEMVRDESVPEGCEKLWPPK